MASLLNVKFGTVQKRVNLVDLETALKIVAEMLTVPPQHLQQNVDRKTCQVRCKLAKCWPSLAKCLLLEVMAK